LVACFRLGWARLLAALLNQAPLLLPTRAVSLQETYP